MTSFRTEMNLSQNSPCSMAHGEENGQSVGLFIRILFGRITIGDLTDNSLTGGEPANNSHRIEERKK